MAMENGGWIYAYSGQWRLACNAKHGGSRFDWFAGRQLGFVVATDEQPRRHVQRHLTAKIQRQLRDLRNSGHIPQVNR